MYSHLEIVILVLLAEDGGNFGSKDRPIAYRVSGKCWVNNHAHVLKPKHGLDVDYLCYALMFYDVTGLVNGATRMKLTQAAMRQMTIPVREFSEQLRIVNLLATVQEIVLKRKQQLSALDDLIKARFVEMFGDIIRNNKGWPQYVFSDIASSRLGKMLDAKQQTGKNKYSYLANFNVQWFRFELKNLNEMDFSDVDQAEFELKDGDLLVCEGGEIGRCAVWHNEVQPCFFQKALHRVRCDNSIILPDYLARWFQYNCEHEGFASIEGAKATIAHLPGVKLKALQVPVPPINLQQEFVSFVAQIDKSKFGEIRFLYTDYIYNKKYGDRKMDITFLIGNGFDIHMGIASAYKKVEAHYANLKKADPRLQAFQKSIAENGEYWSNFEFAIGQYTDRFQDDRQADFQICLDDFTEELIRYLQAEESKIDYDLCGEEIQKEFIRSISKYDESIPNRYRNTINAIISKNGGVNFRFISFNYTHILDQCLERAFKNNAVVGNHAMKGTGYNHIVNRSVLHIHGDLPGPIIMGVDNPGQIANKKWSGQRRFRQKLEKPAINARAGSLVDDEVTKLINGSNIICVYGMSIGETDKTWWKLIGSWLQGADRRLVLFGHSSSYSQVGFTHQRQFDIQNNLIDKFLDLAEIQGAERDALENKIIAVINPNLFNINLVQLSEQKKKVNEIETDAKVKELTAAYEKHKKLAELTTVT